MRHVTDCVHRQCNRWYRQGLIDPHWELHVDTQVDAIELRLFLRERHPLVYRLTAHEVTMDGSFAIHRWLHVIDGELRYSHGHGGPRPHDDYMDSMRYHPRYEAIDYGRGVSFYTGPELYGDFRIRPPDPEAERKSRELFQRVAGEEAYRKLNANLRIDLTGSEGTAYQMIPTSTFNVTRVKDGARLCAVVPGVPLWDHLLGIKLMIEHDEPKFLATANVSVGPRRGRIPSW